MGCCPLSMAKLFCHHLSGSKNSRRSRFFQSLAQLRQGLKNLPNADVEHDDFEAGVVFWPLIERTRYSPRVQRRLQKALAPCMTTSLQPRHRGHARLAN